MPGILVSGAGGFIGRALTAHLDGRGLPVATIGTRPSERAGHWNVAPGPWGVAEWESVLDQVRPEVVFHLAGTVQGSPETLQAVNVDLARDLFGALRRTGQRPALILAGSAAEYGEAVIDGVPVREDAPCAPRTPYGQSKLAQTRAALAFGSETDLRVLVARIFNPIGPGLPRHLALGDFAAQIDGIGPAGGALATGDVEVWRDMLHVDDLAWALAELAGNPKARGVVNLCTGVPTRLRDLLDSMIAASGKPITVTRDPARLRGGERRIIVGSSIVLATLGAQPPLRDLRRAAAGMLTAPARAA
ncbi:NAD-dependent epimerase/dehydratase family protein [Methylobacterium sp. J-068]|uniref:NAD-dependent epimerase/dehydratase family protein n=1 Tax=Methylobacterium sp. J-068 TaxID=2836649 RepID=UPI001FBA803A|nr:NAD-dependent epimerase/dehydratase family protein [Methylobacterium sp. J-068]MCJ2035341.1 NAD-dependent epimerase/dehydratase family protein [Methylobacterium sp. J-068]